VDRNPGKAGEVRRLPDGSIDRRAEPSEAHPIQWSANRFKALAEASSQVISAANVSEALSTLTEAARMIIGAHQAVTSMARGPDLSQADSSMSLSDKYENWRAYQPVPAGSGIYAMVCQDNQAVRMTQAELEEDPRWRGAGINASEHPPLRGWLAAPLTARDGRNLGLIQLSDKFDGAEFDGEDQAILVQLAQFAAAAIEQKQADDALRESESRLRAVVQASPFPMMLHADDGEIKELSHKWCQLSGYSREELKTHFDWIERAYPGEGQDAAELMAQEFNEEGEIPRGEVEVRAASGEKLIWDFYNVRIGRLADGRRLQISAASDITERKLAEAFEIEYRRLLELIASGRPLEECLTAVTAAVSRLQPGVRACVLQCDLDGGIFERSYAAEINASFGEGIHNAPINELAIGTCGEAIFRGAGVTCDDIRTDERWSESWRELCLAHGIRACHSEPVRESGERCIASIMLCFSEPRRPTPWELRIAEFASHLASIAIERDRADQRLRDQEAQFHALAENIPTLCWMADATGWIFWYNSRWYDYSGTTSTQMEGWGWQSLHDPDVLPEVLGRWKSSIADGTPFEMVFPLKGVDGAFRPFLTRVVPVRDEQGKIVRWFGTSTDVAELTALRQTANLHNQIVESALDFAIITTDLEGQVTSWNGGARNIFGYDASEVIGRAADLIFTPEDRAQERADVEMRRAQKHGSAENERLHLRKNGTKFWASGLMMLLLDREGGRHIGFLKILRDRSEQKRHEEHRKLLVDELNHRVKNTLAIVQSLAQQTFRGEHSSLEARRAFDGRLFALANAHNLLTQENWESADLLAVVQAATHAHDGGGERFVIGGPSIRLEPKTAVTVAMALHELAVNAIKYGALSVENGEVRIEWHIKAGLASQPRFQLRWEEDGGPVVRPPLRRGFGSRMIERALAIELNGAAQLYFRPEGLICEIEAPIPVERNN